MLRLLKAVLLALALLVAGSHTARGASILFATLTNGQENPPVFPTLITGEPRATSFGDAIFTLNEDQTAITFFATIYNIDFTGTQTDDPNDNLVAGHIHAGPNVTPTTNAGVVWGFFGNPFNDNNPNDILVTPFTSGVGGTFSGKWDAPEGNNTNLAAQLNNILGGRSYINIHTVQFGGGEVRGALILTPEPSAPLMLAAGLLALICIGSRSRNTPI